MTDRLDKLEELLRSVEDAHRLLKECNGATQAVAEKRMRDFLIVKNDAMVALHNAAPDLCAVVRAAIELRMACQQMWDDWSDSSDQVRNTMWARMCAATTQVHLAHEKFLAGGAP